VPVVGARNRDLVHGVGFSHAAEIRISGRRSRKGSAEVAKGFQ
jgi:hypothetical protein